MTYEKELERADKHITKEYDPQFTAAKSHGLNWYPWVGKEYSKTGILIVGMSTYHKEGADWSDEWRKFCDEDPRPNHVLVSECLEDDGHKPFEAVAKMFIEKGADKDYEDTRKRFWSSVVFLNFCQKLVNGASGPCNDSEHSRAALQKAIEIIKPNLVLAWTTQLWNVGFPWTDDQERDKIGHDIPRVVAQDPPVVGVLHPSWWVRGKDTGAKWLEFLCNEPLSKKPINDFLQHLNNTTK